MRNRLVTLLIAAATVAACGGGASGDQGEVADLFLQAAGDEGIEVDQDCVETAAGKLSDDDAAKILEAGIDGDPDVSDAANDVADEMARCVAVDSLIDGMLAELEGDDTIDVECLRAELDGAADADEVSDRMFGAITTCSTDG